MGYWVGDDDFGYSGRHQIPFESKCIWCGNRIGWPRLTFYDKEYTSYEEHTRYEMPYCSRKCANDDPDSKKIEQSIILQVRTIKAERLAYLNSDEYKKEQEKREIEQEKREIEQKLREQQEIRENEKSKNFVKRVGCGLVLIILVIIFLFIWAQSYPRN